MGIILFTAGLLFGLFITLLFEWVLKKNKKLRRRYYFHQQIFWGYHVHHSTYGLLFILISIFFLIFGNQASGIFILSAGIGVVILHTITGGRFVFIEKQKK